MSIVPIFNLSVNHIFQFLFLLRIAILNEAFHLVNDVYLDVKDMDKLMSNGLGMRYAFLGMFETAHLNAAGYYDYCERFSDDWYKVSKTFKPPPLVKGSIAKCIAKQLESEIPLDKIQVIHFFSLV